MEKTTNKALYAYFGELGIFADNVPGHSFYQLGLMHSLAKKYGINKFDFLNYLDPIDRLVISGVKYSPIYPSDSLGSVFRTYSDLLIDEYRIFIKNAILKIRNGEYSKLFLKARFRNLSTLEKKLDDARQFETLISEALASGLDPKSIVIVDTDLSLSPDFIRYIESAGITREIPSITVAGISKEFVDDCFEAHKTKPHQNFSAIVYYGNLSFDNYKEGHSKNPIAISVLNEIRGTKTIDGRQFYGTVIAKQTDSLLESCEYADLDFVPRENREMIWNQMLRSGISLNVSKDLYIKEGFIPARVYESIIFGIVPVSYNWGYLPMSFQTVDQFFEICKFIIDCSKEDYLKILNRIAKSLVEIPISDK